jgi:hypothetical protein
MTSPRDGAAPLAVPKQLTTDGLGLGTGWLGLTPGVGDTFSQPATSSTTVTTPSAHLIAANVPPKPHSLAD